MTKLKNSFPYPFLALLIFSQVIALFFPWESIGLSAKLPIREEFPLLHFLGLFSHVSILTSGLLKISYDRISLVLVVISLYISFHYYYKGRERLFLISFLYLFILGFAKIWVQWIEPNPSFTVSLLGLLEIPFVLFIHSVVIVYLISFFEEKHYSLDNALMLFKNAYGKIFFFLFVLSLGPEAMPFDELSIYTSKYGVQRAWEIIVYRNLIFDIMFFPLLWGYLLWIGLNPELPFVRSFLELNEVLKSNRKSIVFLGVLYYLGIFLYTLISYYFLEIKYLIVFLPFIYFFTITNFYMKILKKS